jgi:hypothetical protein
MTETNNSEQDETVWVLTQISVFGDTLQRCRADTFDDVTEMVKHPEEHFTIGTPYAGRSPDIAGVKENHHENGRYDILMHEDGFLRQHSHVSVAKVDRSSEYQSRE